MSRKVIKKVVNEPQEFIASTHKDLDRDSKDIKDRPIIFVGKRMTRDQQWDSRDLIELKDPKNTDKGVNGLGKVLKYCWENLIIEVKNVVEPGDSFKGEEKNALWEYEGMEAEAAEAATHFYSLSNLTDEEVKTSD